MTGLERITGEHAQAVLAALVDRDSRAMIELTFAEPSELVPAATGRDVDDVLLDAQRQGMLEGDRGEGDGSVAWWSRLRLTAAGLHALGQWPPVGREAEPGLWDDGYWGTRARGVLAELHEHPPHHRFYFKPISEPGEAWLIWTAALTLGDADLIAGRLTDDGIDGLCLTAAGKRALDPSPRDPLDQAIAELRSGARVDAIVTAVEGALLGRLRQIANGRGVPTTRPDATPLQASRLNNDLKSDGAYDEPTRAQIEAWLKERNALAHARPTVPSDARIEAIIHGLRVFLDEHPA
jgi:hypothetical protein